ncbi:MAG TPA: formylglycine-generating enzyme family protein [Pirellulales bacterium]|nr:formylglycine-generating enzyme family protein [Pirellulales bacterium]
MNAMNTCTVLILMATLMADAAAQSYDDKIDRFLGQCKEYTAKKIVALEKSTKERTAELKRATRARVRANSVEPKTFSSKESKQRYIATVTTRLASDEAELKRLQDGGLAAAPIALPLAVGNIGAWPYSTMIVQQVISPTEMIIICRNSRLLLRGVSTETVADDTRLRVPASVFEVSGTYSYETVQGASKTILVIEPFDFEPFATAERTDTTAERIDAAEVITNSIGMKLALIPAGEFLMGSPKGESGHGENEKQHRVRITKPFYIGVYEVTLGDFLKFYHAANYKSRWESQGDELNGGLRLKNGKYALGVGKQYGPWGWGHPDQTPQHPVVDVSWNDAVAFCEWLSQKEKKRYRLPSETEWEYACRAGTTTRFANGDDEEGLLKVGNVADATFREAHDDVGYGIKGRDGYPFTAPVGRFKPNGFGLYDMHGNVWEWCSDWFDKDYYNASPVDDPRGPAAGSLRVLRGGGWDDSPVNCRSANRVSDSLGPTYRNFNYGFRVVCEVE